MTVASSALTNLGNAAARSGQGVQSSTNSMSALNNASVATRTGVSGVSGSMSNLLSTSTGVSGGIGAVNGTMTALLNSSTNATSGVQGTTGSLGNLAGSANNASQAAQNTSGQVANVGQESQRASLGIKELVVSMGLVALASSAFNAMKSALDGAISRFDTLAGFPVVMERMGFSGEQAQKSIAKLSEGIQGLPTTLNGIVASAQNIAILTGDLDNATDTALALNNAFLASGSSAADAERGLVQYVQMLSKGSVDMQSWRTLQETMGYALNKTAKEFGFAGKAAQNDFYEALKFGAVSFEEFNDKLIELNNGVGGFAEMASTGSEGIATSFGNLKNAVTVGVANIITSFDNLSQATTGKSIYKNIDGLKVIVSSSFKAIGTVIEGTAPAVIAFASAVKTTTPVVKALSPAIIGLTAAYAAYMVITKASAAIQASNAVLVIAQASTSALTLATRAQITAQIASTTATRADAVATVAQTGAITLSALTIGLLTGKVSLSTAAIIAKTVATYAWGAAIKFLMGPIGWVTAGIGLLVTGTIAVVKWFNKATEEGAKLSGKAEELATATDNLTQSTQESAAAHEKNQTKIETNAEAYAQLAAKAEEMASRDKLSAEEKKTLNSYIQELNRNVDGLNLAYGAESKALSASSEQILNRINLMKEEEKLQSAQERLTEIIKEQIEVEQQLKEVNGLRIEWSQNLTDGTIKMGEYKKASAELEEQEMSLKEAHAAAGEERLRIDQQIVESSAAVAAAAEHDTGRQMLMLDELSESQQETVESMKSSWDDYKNAATDMFDTISTKSEISVGKMTKNLETNQKIIAAWSDNIAKLAERGIDEGLLNTLREAGPESAGHVNAIVKASDKELARLSEAFANGGDVATQALVKSMGIENSGVMGAVGHLVVDTEQALAQSIQGAGFEEIGSAVPEGMAKGVEGGTKEAVNATKKMADDSTEAAKKALDVNSPSGVFKIIGTNITEGLVLGINGGSAAVIAAIQKMFQSVQTDTSNSFKNLVKTHDTSVKEIETVLKKLPEITQKSMKDMLDKLTAGTSPQVKVMTTLAKDLLKPFNNTPNQFQTIGGQAMAGFNRGLTSGEAQVMATAKRIADNAANTMRKALDIHSPSRIFEAIGRFVGEGFIIGLESMNADIEKSMTDIGLLLVDVTDHYADEEKKIVEKKNEEITKIEQRSKEDIDKIYRAASAKKRKTTQDENIRIQRIQEDSAKKIAEIEKKATTDGFKQRVAADKEKLKEIKLFVDDKKALEELSLVEEAAIWEESIKLFSEGTKERVEAQKAYNKAAQAIDKENLNNVKAFVDDKKALGELSLRDEIVFWNALYRGAEKGSEQYELGMKSHQTAVKQLRSETEALMKEFNDRALAINKEYADESTKLNKEVSDAYDKQFSQFLNFAGMFEEFKKKTEITGEGLIGNLESQVKALDEYGEVMSNLSGRIDDASLINELKSMGVKSLSELQALNGMSESELEKWVGLYQEKFQKAKELTDAEMQPMKDNVAAQIEKMKNETAVKLEELNKEWQMKSAEIVDGVDKEFDSMKQVGIDAMKGLNIGMASMQDTLVAKATSIANSVKKAMTSAFDINSPSHWMRDMIGKNMMLGWMVGIDREKSATLGKAREAASWMKPDISMVDGFANKLRGVTIPNVNVRPFNPVFSGGQSGNVSHDNRSTFAPQFINHFTPEESTPSEHTRQQKRLAQELYMVEY